MSAQTATRYTCRDCHKTYRSFRSEEEWHASHVADICAARGPRPAAPLPAPPVPAPPVQQPAPVPQAEDGPWWQTSALTAAALAVAALMLLYVAFDGFRIMADADADPKALQLLIAAVIGLPCLYGVYQLGRSAVSVVTSDR